MRLFVAVQPPADFQSLLARCSCGLPGARWLEPETVHLTISFLGEVNDGYLPALIAVLENVQSHSFTLQATELGCFPLRRRPEVLWLGIRYEPALAELKKKIDNALRNVGHRAEKRKYFPHLTLARIRRSPLSRLQEYLIRHASTFWPPFTVDRFVLFSSLLHPDGARHFMEAEYFAS